MPREPGWVLAGRDRSPETLVEAFALQMLVEEAMSAVMKPWLTAGKLSRVGGLEDEREGCPKTPE